MRDDLKKIQNYPDFSYMLTLMRTVNALLFVLYTDTIGDINESPSKTRNGLNAYLFSSSILFESLNVLDVCGKYYREYDAFHEKVVPFLKSMQDFRKTILGRLRNEFVFHYNEDNYKHVINEMKFDEEKYEFIVYNNPTLLDTYYFFADFIPLNSVVNADLSSREAHKEFEVIFKQTTENIKQYIAVVQTLLNERMKKAGFSLKPIKDHEE